MERQFTIHLLDLQFRAFHGWYPEEQVHGNDFLVNVRLELIESMPRVQHLEETVDYSQVYQIIDTRMQQPTPLLETLVEDIADAIRASDARIQRVSITIDKLNPPIKGMKGRVAVQLDKRYA